MKNPSLGLRQVTNFVMFPTAIYNIPGGSLILCSSLEGDYFYANNILGNNLVIFICLIIMEMLLFMGSPKCIESFIGSEIRQPNYTVPKMAKGSVVSRSHDLTKSQNPCFESSGRLDLLNCVLNQS